MDISIEELGKEDTSGTTCSGVQCGGNSILFKVSFSFNTADYFLHLRYNSWYNGEKDITCVAPLNIPYDSTLIGRLRMSISHLNKFEDICTLKIAKLKSIHPVPHANLFQEDTEYFQMAMHIDLASILYNYDAVEIGTKEEVLKSSDRNKKSLIMTINKGDMRAPIVAYVLTRALPLICGVRKY